jgi:hypothetical protein
MHGSARCAPVLARQHSPSRFGNGAAPASGRNPFATLRANLELLTRGGKIAHDHGRRFDGV